MDEVKVTADVSGRVLQVEVKKVQRRTETLLGKARILALKVDRMIKFSKSPKQS